MHLLIVLLLLLLLLSPDGATAVIEQYLIELVNRKYCDRENLHDM